MSERMLMQPNIILIVMDATRARNLSCYGYARQTTPNLDRLAETSVLYEQAITAAGWSLPAHASLFTGLYPSRHGADDQHKYLDSTHPTLAERLSARGYHTLAFCENPYVGPATGLERGFQWFNRIFGDRTKPAFRKMPRLKRKLTNGFAKLRGAQDAGAAHINAQVLASLRRLPKTAAPFFMFMHYEDTHAPYRLPKKFARFLPINIDLNAALQVNQDPWQHLINPRAMTSHDFEILRALYDSEIFYVDYRIGQVLDELRALQMFDTSLIIVTADHGENIGEHGMLAHKYCLYDTLMHVPLLIHYPVGVSNPGRVSHQVQTLDLVPTILNLLDDHAARETQGCDLLSSTRRDFTIAEQSRPDLSKFHTRFPGVDVSRFDRTLTMFRTERYKFIWASDGKHELYDLADDPSEQKNLIGALPHVAQELSARLEQWRTGFTKATPTQPAPAFDDEVAERLRALGYLE